MSAARKLAVKISAFVVRRASPGCKEWAEGLAREMDFIASDWSALWWAVGSLRVLLEPQERMPGTLAEVRRLAIQHANSVRGGMHGLWYPMFCGPMYVVMFFSAKSQVRQEGCVPAVACSVGAWAFCLATRRRVKDPSSDDIYDDDVACAIFYRAELARRGADLLASGVIVIGFVVGSLLTLNPPDEPFELGVGLLLGLFLLMLTPAMVRAQRTTKRRIERIDELLMDGR